MKNLYVFAAFEERAFKPNDRFVGYCKWITLWYTLFVHIHPWNGIHADTFTIAYNPDMCEGVMRQHSIWTMKNACHCHPVTLWVLCKYRTQSQIRYHSCLTLTRSRTVTVTICTAVYYLSNKFNYSQKSQRCLIFPWNLFTNERKLNKY